MLLRNLRKAVRTLGLWILEEDSCGQGQEPNTPVLLRQPVLAPFDCTCMLRARVEHFLARQAKYVSNNHDQHV